MFPLQDVVIKKLSGHYPVLQIVFIRGLVSLWALALLAWWERGPAGLSTVHHQAGVERERRRRA